MVKTASTLDVAKIREDFPILRELAHGQPLVYLDNAATSQKPQAVLDSLDNYWRTSNANVHRGVHALSQKATALFEGSRETIREYINAKHAHEVILTKGCTEGINLVAQSYGRPLLKPGDEILVSTMEHHSNIVPWQIVAEQTGAIVRAIPISDDGEILMDEFEALLSERARIVAVVHVSNSIGTINPVKQIAAKAHAAGAVVLIDGAQAGPHEPIDVQDIDADFFTLSCHKIYAPTGIGVLYGKERLLESMSPYHGGGDMIRTVSFEGTTYAGLPNKFEAGTPNIAGAIGLGAALRYVASIGRTAIKDYENDLTAYAMTRMAEVDGIQLKGPARNRASIVSFTMAGVHPHDIGTILDAEGIAVRAGHHCCMPLMKRMGVPATARASFAFYNTREEVDKLVDGVKKIREMLA